MELLYKPDWEVTKKRLVAWWAHEDIGRCALAVTAEKKDAPHIAPPPLPGKVGDRWIDFDYQRALQEYNMQRTFYGGEAIPVWNPGDNWIHMAGFLGCPIELRDDTGWPGTILEKGDLTGFDYRKITIDPDKQWWKFSVKMHHQAVEAARGKSIPGIQALGGCADTLAQLRGTQQLLLDVMDCPGYVRDFDQYLMKQWNEVYEKFYQITREGAEGSTTWPSTNVWAPGRFYFPMCDFSYMISTKMYTDLFLPSIEMQVNYLDYSLYHLDGVRAFAHIDVILALSKLNGVQVVPGDGKPNALHYMDLLKKIQRAGKNLWISLPPEDVETALENLSAKGLFINTSCETEEEARNLIIKAEKLSKIRTL
jgi:hypothetical protein